MNLTLLKRLNLVLYGIAIFLFVMLFLPIGQWFGILNVNFKLTFFIIPFFGLASLPTAIYTKNVRQILLSVLLVALYFILFSLITALSSLFHLNFYSFFFKWNSGVKLEFFARICYTKTMTKADIIFKENIRKIMEEGVFSENARPRYKDGNIANSKYVTGAFAEYDLSKGEFPITTLRPIPIKSAIKEILWIYQDQTNDLSVLQEKYGVQYWNDWEVEGTGTIGERYGAIVKKHAIISKILKQLEENPWNRRNVISLWDYEAFDQSAGLLPCAFQTMFDVRRVDGEIYLDATLTQRSNDMLVAHHINAMQYVALQMMIAKHFGWKVGKFFYFINNLHIYDNQFEQAEELLRRTPSEVEPRLVLNVPDGTNFFDIRAEDFELVDYNPVKPQLKFDLAI